MSSLKPNIDARLFSLTQEQIASGTSKHYDSRPVSLERLEKEFYALERIEQTDKKHEKALFDLFPQHLLDTCDKTDWQLFLAMSRYDRRSDTFATGCYDNQPLDFKLISYKWQMKDGIKWKTRAGSSPNGTLFIRIFTDDRTIYVVEGHRDALTAILLGLDFIMVPYAGFKLADSFSLQKEVAGREVVFIVEDKAAFKCMFKIAQSIEDSVSSITMMSLAKGQKVDLSDYVRTKNSIEEIIDELENKKYD